MDLETHINEKISWNNNWPLRSSHLSPTLVMPIRNKPPKNTGAGQFASSLEKNECTKK